MARRALPSLAAAAVVGAMSLGSVAAVAGSASAQSTTSTTVAAKPAAKPRPQSRQTTLAGLVTAGTITKAQADAIYAAIKAAAPKPTRGTQATTPTPPTTTLANREAARRTKYAAIVAPLVANATITQAQADAAVSALATRPDVTGTADAKPGRAAKSGKGKRAGHAASGTSPKPSRSTMSSTPSRSAKPGPRR